MATVLEAQQKGFEKAVMLTPKHVQEFLCAELDDLEDARARICPSCGWVSKRKARRNGVLTALALVLGLPAVLAVMTLLLGEQAMHVNSLIVTVGVLAIVAVAVQTIREAWSRECGHCHEGALVRLSADDRSALEAQVRKQLRTSG